MHDIENCCSLLYICLWLFKYTKCSAVFFRSIQTLSLHFPDEPFNIGAQYWDGVYNDIVNSDILSYGECSFIKGIADYIRKNKLPSSAQIKKLLKIIAKAEEKGYIMP